MLPLCYDPARSYDWNYAHVPRPVERPVTAFEGSWSYCGLPVDSPLAIAAGPLLNGGWCRYYASLGFDILTYKTVRSSSRACYPLPNLQPVRCQPLTGEQAEVPACSGPLEADEGSWAVSFGMPSRDPVDWRDDVRDTRRQLRPGQLLSVSVVGSVQPGWTLEQLADDYARCGAWAAASGADCVEANFSCPNVDTCDGQLYQQPAAAGQIAQAIAERIGGLPLLLKIGHLTDPALAAALLDAVSPWAAALVMTNSVAARVRDQGELLFGGARRGICGAAIRDASLKQVQLFADLIARQRFPIQLVGVGGISSANHVQQYLASGAHAVQLATAPMLDPEVGLRIRRNVAGTLRVPSALRTPNFDAK